MSLWTHCLCEAPIPQELSLADEILGTVECPNCGRENGFFHSGRGKRPAVRALIERVEALEAVIQP